MCLLQSLCSYRFIFLELTVYIGTKFLFLVIMWNFILFFLHCLNLRSIELQWTEISQSEENRLHVRVFCRVPVAVHVFCPLLSLGYPVPYG